MKHDGTRAPPDDKPKRGPGRPKGSGLGNYRKSIADNAVPPSVVRAAAEEMRGKVYADAIASAPVMSDDTVQAMLADIRAAMLVPMPPREILSGICKKYSVASKTAQKYFEVVQNELRKTVGFIQLQMRDLVDKACVRILKDQTAKPSDVLNAAKLLHDLYDLKMRDEADEEAEQAMLIELQRRMKTMNFEELDEFKLRITSGKLDALFDNPTADIDGEDLAPQSTKRRQRVAKSNQGG